MERVIVYIDGFNLYFGLKSKSWQRYYWLNLKKLAQALLTENQHLVLTKYFTSRVSKPPEKAEGNPLISKLLKGLMIFKFITAIILVI